MNPPVPPLLKPRRRYGRWVLLGLVVIVTPIVIVTIGVASMLTLSRDAAVLRREVMAATDADWHTKVQMSVGGITLGAVRTGLRFVQAEHMDEARLALAAVRSASVGVYECRGAVGDLSLEQLFARTDKKMKARGWSRLVGVAEDNKSVLIYTSDDNGSGSRLDLCLAVVEGDKLIVVSTNVETEALMELAVKHLPEGGFRGKLKQAKLRI
jgi:hypothetical protein